MTIHVDAIYEGGAFRPTKPVALHEGTQVVLTVETDVPLSSPQRLVVALAEIAAMPAQSPDDGFSGSNHDDLLYGPEGAR
jgi:predicted DNA-binding antitoxin AbrB/MazE fold protein